MIPTKKKPVKRAATVEPMVQYIPLCSDGPESSNSGYFICKKDLPRVVEAMASACRGNVITGNPGDKCLNPYYVTHAQLRAIGIDLEGGK